MRHLARRGGCPAGKAGREDQNLLRFPGPNGEAFGPVGRMSDGEGLDTVNKAAEGNRRLHRMRLQLQSLREGEQKPLHFQEKERPIV